MPIAVPEAVNEVAGMFWHPAFIFLAFALLLLVLRGDWWRYLLPIPALLAIGQVMGLTPGLYTGVDIEYMGFHLVLGRVDQLSIVFAHVFAIQSLIGLIYAMHVKDKGQHIAALTYVGGAFGCVFAGDYLSLFVFWELMSLGSTMLILYNHAKNRKAAGAGLRYFLIHTLGGLIMLAGVMLRYKALGTYDFIHIDPMGAQYYDWLIMLGVGVNAAMIGLHAWLPDAYPEATITGAVFMSAFTTKTAVYVLARGFAGWEFLAWMGVGMTLYGVVYATIENNARRILSYHIMSQVGYMVAGVGIGTYMTVNGAAAHAYAHILYKGLLFMSCGCLLYACGTAKLTELGGLAARLPYVALAYVVAGLSISGWPIFNGFVSKSMTIAGAFEAHQPLLGMGMEIAAVGTFLSVGLKLPYFAFWAKPTDYQREIKPIPPNMYVALGIASALCIAQGVYPQMLYALLPFEVEFKPWETYKVLQAAMLLGFTGLGFYLLRRTMKPHAQYNIDFELLYRILGRAFLYLVSRPVAWLDTLWSEVYRTGGLRGLRGTAWASAIFDRKGIDTVVDGTAYSVGKVGRATARIQTGRLQDYLAMAVGLALFIFLIVWVAMGGM
jgi:multicomponent Na+:H+ antiporter subunit D